MIYYQKTHFFRDLSLTGFHFVPVPNHSRRKPFILSQYFNCCIFIEFLIFDITKKYNYGIKTT